LTGVINNVGLLIKVVKKRANSQTRTVSRIANDDTAGTILQVKSYY